MAEQDVYICPAGERLAYHYTNEEHGLVLRRFAIFDVVYEGSRALAEGQRIPAFRHAHDVIDAEQALGIYRELDLQHWVIQAPGFFSELANRTYFNCQFTISFGFLLWVYFRRNHAFYFARNVIIVADFIGLIGYVYIPTAPPRFYPRVGFIDTLHGRS